MLDLGLSPGSPSISKPRLGELPFAIIFTQYAVLTPDTLTGSVAGSLRTENPMNITYTLVDNQNSNLEIVGNEIRVAGDLAVGTYTLTIEASNESGWSQTFSETIEVEDAIPSWVAKDASGMPAILVLDQPNDRGWYNEEVYDTEAAALAAVNGTQSGIARAIGDYVAPDAPELLANGDLSQGLGSWTALNGATATVVNGELEMNGTGLSNPSVRSSAATTSQGKVYRAKASYRKGTATGNPLVITSRASTLSPVGNSLPSNTTTSSVTNQRIFGGEGSTAYLALRTVSGPGGTVYGDDFSIREATAFAGFKSSEFAAIVHFRTPAVLPASPKVLFSFDDSGARNRYRIALNADGTVSIILDSNGVNRITNTIPADLVTLDTEHKLHLSSNGGAAAGSNRFLAGLDDAYLFGSQGGFTPPGCGWVRIGASPTAGEEWTGQIYDIALFDREYAPPQYLWAVGDSYVAGTGGASVEQGVEASSSRQVISTGAGGSALATQIANMQANPGMYSCPLIHWDGDANGANLATDQIVFETMAALCPRHIFIGSGRRANNTDIVAATNQRNAWLSNTFGDRYLDPHPALYALSDGSASDIAAVAAQQIPPSCLQGDGTHLTSTAMAAVGAAIAGKVAALGF